jgi:hypothetical protein
LPVSISPALLLYSTGCGKPSPGLWRNIGLIPVL